ncbi:MAG: DUF4391 domain-containing protein [Owenweeksia sp.]|nr:DUF4391 domain-containing protein [Owenweeksia sp.]
MGTIWKHGPISTSKKHPHPANEDNAVIDWTFKTDWFAISDNPYNFKLRKNLDFVFKNLCLRLSGKNDSAYQSLDQVIEIQKKKEALEKQISRIKTKISSKGVQFKEKVELNMELQKLEQEQAR